MLYISLVFHFFSFIESSFAFLICRVFQGIIIKFRTNNLNAFALEIIEKLMILGGKEAY